MKNPLHALATLALFSLLLLGCRGADLAEPRPFEMTSHDVTMVWGITKFQEEPCSGTEMAGGEVSGVATFTGIGDLTFEMSSAWDIGDLIADDAKQYEPTSAAAPDGGPAARVFGTADYPYAFQYDPFTDACLAAGQSTVVATGLVTFTDADGDELDAVVVGGETHRLDFIVEGDGIETFAEIEFTGGTGRFADATGSFVAHTIARYDLVAEAFVLDLVEVLPGGTVRY